MYQWKIDKREESIILNFKHRDTAVMFLLRKSKPTLKPTHASLGLNISRVPDKMTIGVACTHSRTPN